MTPKSATAVDIHHENRKKQKQFGDLKHRENKEIREVMPKNVVFFFFSITRFAFE